MAAQIKNKEHSRLQNHDQKSLSMAAQIKKQRNCTLLQYYFAGNPVIDFIIELHQKKSTTKFWNPYK